MALTIRPDELGPSLRKRRDELGWSLRRLEEVTGVSAPTLSRVERGHIPDLAAIERIAHWMGVNVQAAGELQTRIESDNDLLNAIEIHLRASKNLPDDLARTIARNIGRIMDYEVQKAGWPEEP